jgi:outer membrane protein OmpA-like peptidoglycan-associated protein
LPAGRLRTVLPLLAFAFGLTGVRTARAQDSSITFGASADAQAGTQAPPSASAQAQGVAAAPQGAPAGDAASAEEAEWAERDQKLKEQNTLAGAVGLLRTQHAQSGAPGQFRLAFVAEYFTSGFLCTEAYPCRNPRGAGTLTSDTLDHIGGTLSLGVSIAKIGSGVLEGYGSTTAMANSSNANRPGLLQVLGDSALGLRFVGPVARAVHVGGVAELQLVNGTGSVGLSGGGTSARFGPVFTLDLRELGKPVPLRFSLNGFYSLDNRGQVVEDTERARNAPINRVERFGLGINRVDHLDFHIGAEGLFAEERVRPFVEYGIMVPVNRQNYLCRTNNPSNDDCLANEKVAPSRLTLGSRFFPWKGQGLSVLAALDIGITGTGRFIEEVAPTPPWTAYLGLGWAVDTKPRPPKVITQPVERIVERAPAMAQVKGLVHEQGKEEGIANAIVSWESHPQMTALATGADGRFTTHAVGPGEYRFVVRADGYREGTCAATVPQEVTDQSVDCALEALPRVGTVRGIVRDAETQQPVANALVRLTDGMGRTLQVSTDPQGTYRIENVPPGTISLMVEAEDYMAAAEPSEVKVREEKSVDLLVRRKPKKPLVAVTADEITIKQQIQFAVDSAVILPESLPLLTEIADTIIRNPRIKRIEVQGHTDNTGTAERNRTLSEERAESVRGWLVSHGVTPDRLVAKGYGQDKPRVPNVTAANKQRNRRVQFVILEQDRPADAPAGGTGPKSSAPVPKAPF